MATKAKKTDKKTDKKQIKFKGIEFEEISEEKYYSTPYTIPFFQIRIGKIVHYYQNKKPKCGQVVKG